MKGNLYGGQNFEQCAWERKSAIFMIVYSFTGYNQWFGWMTENLKGT